MFVDQFQRLCLDAFMTVNSAASLRCIGALLLCSLLVTSSTGCVGGVVANLIHAAKGNKVPAEFGGLVEKRVAVVCVSQSESFGTSPIAPQVAEKVGKLLATNVEDIQLVEQQEIADWFDRNDWDGVDYVAIGRSVKADAVVAIDIDSFSLSDGATMYKGRADVGLTVYDIASGEDVFSNRPPEIQYPKNAVFHTADMSKREFRRRFLNILSQRIARTFYPYDFQENFAQDTTLITSS